MTRVDFYVLKSDTGSRHGIACRLVEKVNDQGRRIYIHTGSQAEAEHLNRLLWTFRENSFIPHGIVGLVDQAVTPVLLGHGPAPEQEQDVLINLAPEVPEFFSRFSRLAEIIDSDQQVKESGRQRYRFYKERGYPLDTHELKQ